MSGKANTVPMTPRIVSRGWKIREVPKSITFKLLNVSFDSNTRFSGLRSLEIEKIEGYRWTILREWQ